MRFANTFGAVMPVGFYYKAFHRPRWAAAYWETFFRHMSGLGRVRLDRLRRRTPKRYETTDVLVVGAGAAGLSAAIAAAEAGAAVVLVDENARPGGSLTYANGGAPDAAACLGELLQRAARLPNLAIRCGTVAAAYYADHYVPLVDATRKLVNADRLAMTKKGIVILNFAREGIVDDQAVVDAIDEGHVHGYISDFPTNITKNHRRCVTLPHLGASTAEAEDNCAIMVADQVRDFLENGNVRNAVNFPEVVVPRRTAHRLVCANANVPNMLGQISEAFGQAGLNIHDMVNSSKGELAYTVADLDGPVPESVVKQIAGIKGVVMVRLIDAPR
jgi:hypothetical protein